MVSIEGSSWHGPPEKITIQSLGAKDIQTTQSGHCTRKGICNDGLRLNKFKNRHVMFCGCKTLLRLQEFYMIKAQLSKRRELYLSHLMKPQEISSGRQVKGSCIRVILQLFRLNCRIINHCSVIPRKIAALQKQVSSRVAATDPSISAESHLLQPTWTVKITMEICQKGFQRRRVLKSYGGSDCHDQQAGDVQYLLLTAETV